MLQFTKERKKETIYAECTHEKTESNRHVLETEETKWRGVENGRGGIISTGSIGRVGTNEAESKQSR